MKLQAHLQAVRYFGFAIGLLSQFTLAQESISLDQCLRLAELNHPLAQQNALLDKQLEYEVAAAEKSILPQMEMNGQITYQSDVTYLPVALPNLAINPPNKDQYRTTLDAKQLIYQGGLIDAAIRLKNTQYAIEKQSTTIALYELKTKVNHLFFSVLMIQNNQALVGAHKNLLQNRLAEVHAGVLQGVLLPSTENALQVELLRTEQKQSELAKNREGLLLQLELLTHSDLDPQVVLLSPPTTRLSFNETEARRPELELFELQKQQTDQASVLLDKSKSPKISAFVQGGYGNPGLNMLENSFTGFFISGVKLNWKILDWSKTRKEQQVLSLNKDKIESQAQAFKLNNQLELNALQTEIDKLSELIQFDQEIVSQYETVLNASESQLQNGTITASAYLMDATQLLEAKQQQALHETQKQFHQIQFHITEGTYETSRN